MMLGKRLSAGCRSMPRTRRRVECTALGVVDSLRQWIQGQGGYIHEHLALVDCAPCGVRGVVVVRDVDQGMLETKPLICVPKHMQLDDIKAAALLEAALSQLYGTDLTSSHSEGRQKLPPGHQQGALGAPNGVSLACLSSTQLLAVALAYEAARGERSSWAPYISSLPPQPPCPWILSAPERPAAVAAALGTAPVSVFTTLGNGSSSDTATRAEDAQYVAAARARLQAVWEQEVGVVAGEQAASATHALSACGAALGLSHQQILWGLGQIVSRGLTSSSSCALLPFIDLLNHSPSARPPMMQLDDNDQLVTTVTSLKDGELYPMQAGQELYINYSGGGAISPLEAFIKFGFVPQEAWEQGDEGHLLL